MHKMRDKIKWKTRPKNKPQTQIPHTPPPSTLPPTTARIGGARSTEPEPKAETEAEFETETKAIG